MAWRFYLQELPSKEWIDRDLPLSDATVIEPAANKPATIEGNLPPDFYHITNPDGEVVLRKYHCQIVAEQDGKDPVVCIVDNVTPGSDHVQVSAGGFSSYIVGMPWLDEEFLGVQVDPLDMFRKIWAHAQDFDNAYKGIVVDDLKSPEKVGTEPEPVEFTTDEGEDVSFTAGPFKLSDYVETDLDSKVQDLAEETPFQYMEESKWLDENKTLLETRLRLAYPRFGRRKTHLRFEIGVNIMSTPEPVDEEYATDMYVLGAGEGVKRTRVLLNRPSRGLRKVVTHNDTSIDSKVRATRTGKPILKKMRGEFRIDAIELIDHEWAPFHSFNPEDEVRLVGDVGWADLDMVVRVVEKSHDCTTGRMTVRVDDL